MIGVLVKKEEMDHIHAHPTSNCIHHYIEENLRHSSNFHMIPAFRLELLKLLVAVRDKYGRCDINGLRYNLDP